MYHQYILLIILNPTIEMLEEQILQSKILGVLSIIGFIAIVVSIVAYIK